MDLEDLEDEMDLDDMEKLREGHKTLSIEYNDDHAFEIASKNIEAIRFQKKYPNSVWNIRKMKKTELII